MTNGGFIGALLYSFSTMIISGIGSLIMSIFLIIITLYLFFSETMVSLYRQKKSEKKIVNQKRQEANKTKVFETKPIEDSQKTNVQKEVKEDLPFEDPF